MGRWSRSSVICIVASIGHTTAIPASKTVLDDASLAVRQINPHNGTQPDTVLTDHGIWCMDPSVKGSQVADLGLCNLALDAIITRDGIEEFHREQEFWSGGPNQIPPPAGTHETPDFWQLDDGKGRYCEIVVSGGGYFASDKFALLDIAVEAKRIIDGCLGPGKNSLGGGSLVGDEEDFAVYVNGRTKQPQYQASLESPSASNTTANGTNNNSTFQAPNIDPAIFNLTNLKAQQLTNIPGKLDCFDPDSTEYESVSVNSETCELLFNEMIRRDGIDTFYQKRDYFLGEGVIPNGAVAAPQPWRAGTAESFCGIKLACVRPPCRDKFSMFEVAAGAYRVLHECILNRPKREYGGWFTIGRKGFFVGINGESDPPNMKPVFGAMNGTVEEVVATV